MFRRKEDFDSKVEIKLRRSDRKIECLTICFKQSEKSKAHFQHNFVTAIKNKKE